MTRSSEMDGLGPHVRGGRVEGALGLGNFSSGFLKIASDMLRHLLDRITLMLSVGVRRSPVIEKKLSIAILMLVTRSLPGALLTGSTITKRVFDV